jgi:XTP/dITP diphosphohydrolase
VVAEGARLVEFIEVMRRLRAECPWKAEQTHRSLARYLLEETHETLEAIDSGDADHLREELGDLLLQIYFHAAIASEAGEFTIDDVAADLTEKMRRRNPHVFGSATAVTSAQVNDQWQQAKADEKQRSSVTDGLPPGLPALLYADKVLDRLARSGFEARAARTPTGEGQLGERLLDLVREARAEGVDPEQTLRDAVRREIAAAEE